MLISVKEFALLDQKKGGSLGEGAYGFINTVNSISENSLLPEGIRVLYISKEKSKYNNLYIGIIDNDKLDNFKNHVVKKTHISQYNNIELYGCYTVARCFDSDKWNLTQFSELVYGVNAYYFGKSFNEFYNKIINKQEVVNEENNVTVHKCAPICIISSSGMIYPLFAKCIPLSNTIRFIEDQDQQNFLRNFIKHLHTFNHSYNDVKITNIVRKNDGTHVFCDYGSIQRFDRFTGDNFIYCNMNDLGSSLPSPHIVRNSNIKTLCSSLDIQGEDCENLEEIFSKYYTRYANDVASYFNFTWDFCYQMWFKRSSTGISNWISKTYEVENQQIEIMAPANTADEVAVLKLNDYWGLGIVFKDASYILTPNIQCLYGGGNNVKYMTLLGRRRKLTKKGRCWMLTYQGRQISLTEARKLQKGS